jgi:hypothetical protein
MMMGLLGMCLGYDNALVVIIGIWRRLWAVRCGMVGAPDEAGVSSLGIHTYIDYFTSVPRLAGYHDDGYSCSCLRCVSGERSSAGRHMMMANMDLVCPLFLNVDICNV